MPKSIRSPRDLRALARHGVEYVTVGRIAIQVPAVPIAHHGDLLMMKRGSRPRGLADVQLLESLDEEP